jgi:hypothetical protein
MANPYSVSHLMPAETETPTAKSNTLVWAFAFSSMIAVELYFACHWGFHIYLERIQRNPERHVITFAVELLVSVVVGFAIIQNSDPPRNRALHVATRIVAGVVFASIFMNTERLAGWILHSIHLQFSGNIDVAVLMLVMSVASAGVIERSMRRAFST